MSTATPPGQAPVLPLNLFDIQKARERDLLEHLAIRIYTARTGVGSAGYYLSMAASVRMAVIVRDAVAEHLRSRVGEEALTTDPVLLHAMQCDPVQPCGVCQGTRETIDLASREPMSCAHCPEAGS